jgi:Cu/Ag efflux pump CusA
MLIDTPGGGDVRLGQVADVRMGSAPTVIERDAVSRFVDVKANISGRSLGAVSSDVEARLANAEFPLEYHAEVRQASTNRDVILAMVGFGIVVAIAIFLVLQAALRSWRLAALAFLTLPVGLAGGVLAALVNGAALSLGALIAFLAILGLAARNGIMLIHHCQRLRLDEGYPFGADLVRQVAAERLAPILTTASALALVTLPFVIMGNVAGLEIVHPMAIVMLGGLITTTLLSLFMLPVLYLRFGAGPQPETATESPSPPAVAAERPRLFGSAPERRAGAARAEQTAEAGANPPRVDGENASPGRRGE